MKETWAQFVHSPECLYDCRRLRFRDEMKVRFLDSFSIEDGPIRILEIGCGSGAFSQRLAQWYPMAEVIGLDVDVDYISYARRRVTGVSFYCHDLREMDSFVAVHGTFDYVFTHSMFGFVNTSELMDAIVMALHKGGCAITVSNRLSMGLRSRLWDPPCPEFKLMNKEDEQLELLCDKRDYTAEGVILELKRYGMSIEKVDYIAVPLQPFGNARQDVREMYRKFQRNRLEMLGRRKGYTNDAIKVLCEMNDKLFVSLLNKTEETCAGILNVDVLEIIKSKLPCAGQS